MATARDLPDDRAVLDMARRALSDARDWLNSDTSDAIAGRRTAETERRIQNAMASISAAKASIDAAKRVR